MNIKFRKADGSFVLDAKNYVADWLKRYPKGEIHVGCDSKRRGNSVKYSLSICMRNGNSGVHEIYGTYSMQNIPDNFSRLWEEVDRVVKLAQHLSDLSKITVHVDINRDPKFLSNRLYDASIGYISSMGFMALGKPDAWAASLGAHTHCQ